MAKFLQYTLAAGLFATIGYFASKAHESWDAEATRSDGVVVKAGRMPTVRFTPENGEPVEVMVGTFSSIDHSLDEELTILYKAGPSTIAYIPNNPPFDVRVAGVRPLDVGILYLLSAVFIVIAALISVRDSLKRMRE